MNVINEANRILGDRPVINEAEETIPDDINDMDGKYVVLGGKLPSEHKYQLGKIISTSVQKGKSPAQNYDDLEYRVKIESGEIIPVRNDELDHVVFFFP